MFAKLQNLLWRGPGGARRRRRLAGLIRLSTYLTALGGASSFLLARAASARLDEAVEHLGETLMQKLGPELIGQTQEILVNGQTLLFASQLTERPLATVLDELSRHCESQANPALAALAALPAEERRPFDELGDLRRAGVGRAETGDHVVGQVACIAHRQQGASLEEALERTLRFIDTGDLAELGDARYFVVRKLAEGQSQVISIWTQGTFDLAGMFPAEGDAPGADSARLPRPPAARRTFSALLPRQPYALRMYESRAPREAILSHYDQRMADDGWREQPTSAGDELRGLTRAFSRGGEVVFVILDAARDGETPVTLVEVGGRGAVHAGDREGR